MSRYLAIPELPCRTARIRARSAEFFYSFVGRHYRGFRMDLGKKRSYLGTWILVTELCLYEEGSPPVSGIYRISLLDGDVRISTDWEAQDGSKHRIEFQARDSGVKQPSNNPGTSHFSITRISPLILDSRAYVDDEEVAYARRRVSDDGLLLATVQSGRRANGTSFRNFQVYRRQTTGDA